MNTPWRTILYRVLNSKGLMFHLLIQVIILKKTKTIYLKIKLVEYARIQGAPTKQKGAVSVISMEAAHGLCADIQDAPPK